jgi:hypothetical protein
MGGRAGYPLIPGALRPGLTGPAAAPLAGRKSAAADSELSC